VTPRAVALGLGVIFALLTVAELLFGGWQLGEVEVLRRTTLLNLLHWVVALALLGAFFAGAGPSRMAARVVGLALLALGIWGLVSSNTLGSFLGFPDEIPGLYNAYHGSAAVLALIGGFGSARQPA
jgi:hypothetical protein